MYSLGDIAFIEGNLESYKYRFQNTKKEFLFEYIHCIVLERLEEDLGYIPRKIRVNQIHNLEQYFSNPDYNDFSERILKTDNITEMVNIRQ
jgi:hypothetical protein